MTELRISVVDEELWKRFRKAAIVKDKTVGELFEIAIRSFLEADESRTEDSSSTKRKWEY
jgi:hypothetical protein